MDFQYIVSHSPLELRDIYSHPDVPGLYYWPNCTDSDISTRVMDFINSEDVVWKAVGSGSNSRRAFHTGYDYDYKSGRVTPTAPIPDTFQELAARARQCCMALQLHDDSEEGQEQVPEFDQCLLNEYMVSHSQGITWHTDHKAFGPFITCYTFGSGTEMQFRLPGTSNVVSVRVEPGSLYIMSGDARWEWQHCMPGRKSDPNPNGGKRIPRGDRYSVTFRSVPHPN